MSSREYYHTESDVIIARFVIVFLTLITDGFDFINVILSMDEMRTKQTVATGTCAYLYCCSCLCLSCSGCCLLCTMCCSCSFPVIDVVSCLVVWLADLPQASLDVYFYKDPMALHTFFNLPDAAAVLTVTLVRIVLLVIRRTSKAERTGPEEECGTSCQNFPTIGLFLNLGFTIFSLIIRAIDPGLRH